VLVLVGLEALAGALDLDLALAHDLGLTAEPRGGANVERLVEDVGLFVLLLAKFGRSFRCAWNQRSAERLTSVSLTASRSARPCTTYARR
jgi:hypothetical protein